MAESAPVFSIDDYQARRLDPERDGGIVQALHERCADYMQVVEGRPPGPDAARAFFRVAPDGWRPEDVDKLGVFAPGGRLVGLVDSARGYPEPGITYLGLMLLDPSVRGGGLGARLYRAFEEWAAGQGARQIRLSVVADNEPAHRFWRRVGFVDVEAKPPRPMGDKVQGLFEMERVVAGGT